VVETDRRNHRQQHDRQRCHCRSFLRTGTSREVITHRRARSGGSIAINNFARRAREVLTAEMGIAARTSPWRRPALWCSSQAGSRRIWRAAHPRRGDGRGQGDPDARRPVGAVEPADAQCDRAADFVYVSLLSGPRRATTWTDRSSSTSSSWTTGSRFFERGFREMLNCIRCGALRTARCTR
jgi:hypothetical protein